MRRRQFLVTLGGVSLGSSLASTAGATETGSPTAGTVRRTVQNPVPPLAFESTASLLDGSYGPLTDPSLVAVWAEDTATNHNADGNGDATIYGGSGSIPLVAVDWNVVGFGAMLVTDGTNFQSGNEEFVLNVWDDALGGSGTVLWDESHGQYYDLASFPTFESYAENSGYTVQATTNLQNDLSSADAAVITSPAFGFSGGELSALGSFVANGGWLFLHDQSDYSDFDGTAYLNDVAGYLGLEFRFNDDEVVDDIQNAGSDYQPTTDEFNTAFPYFEERPGLGLDPTATYTVPVTEVIDGDTVKVQMPDGTEENIRILGTDTPETSANSQFERIQEWEGIEDTTYLESWAASATSFAQAELGGETVDLHFDPNEPVRDAFGRVLGYLSYDATGDGNRDANYNRELVAEGYARIYDSGFTMHETFWDAEQAARSSGLGVWTQSDPANSTEIRNRDVDDLFFPTTASVRTSSGAISSSRVPVTAESTATQDLDGGVSYGGNAPLVGLDESAGVAVVGGPIVDESYEQAEDYPVDTSTYENFVFLTNLVDHLSSNDGDVLVDGGHGQFGASFGLSAEDTAYYMRYLEGVGIGLEGVNAITPDNLTGARALVVTTPPEAFTSSEVSAVNDLLAEGGAVVLVGGGKVTAEARTNLNDLASGIGTDLRVNEDQVLDGTNNVDSDSEVPTTTQFDLSFPLFDAYGSGGGSPTPDVETTQVHADAQGNDNQNLNDEYVVITNEGTADADLSGWTVQDEASKTYTFPGGFTLGDGDSVTLHTGSGTDTATDLYWGRGSAVWNNGGDTVYIHDNSGTLVDQHSYGSSSGDHDVKTTQVHEDAAGNDNQNLNDEYVVITNEGTADADLTGWTVEDEAGKSYSFPNGFVLDEAMSVTLHSGTGTDTESDLYWGRTGSAVWNNSGDTVYIYDDSGTLVDEHAYGGSGGGGSPDVKTTQVHEDAQGNDNNNLNDEYVVISNEGTADADMTGWEVQDEASKTYTFPGGFTLGDGDSVTLHSGSGTDTSTDLYWDASTAVWNNSGDTVYIYDDSGSLVDQHAY